MNTLTRRPLTGLLAAAVLTGGLAGPVLVTSAWSTTPDTDAVNEQALLSGDEIAARINARDDGDSVARSMTMELVDKRGKKRTRKTRSFRKYFETEKRIAIFFEKPRNVRDTAFLTFDYLEDSEEDAQWLYLPALRRVRRISGSDRGDYFMGTDFTYDDIRQDTKVSRSDYNRTTLGMGEVDGRACYVMEGIPASEDIAEQLGYSRTVSCVDAEIWMVLKSEIWDLQGKKLKTIHTRDIRQVQGIWTAHLLEAENHKTGHKTTFIMSEVDYLADLSDDLFTRSALKRGL
ncbi:outer membrane lipoprotein-sorting protein [Denitrobaculum tricleocarpae]|uniref:Outer membrane lipoprotein-sorting protein n=1 Tax=Denitrobaculum tricleocarpae TaxID=2591009 RepID=A0A545TG90_9PROT|nr:outer membrane lipoprotein-sorting protein [Denitrobaculum tricleocarpae]TQV76237.1 outer membrane lipoprotein-sorting protein [Denitrobaculum tricleocarpae]